MRLPRRPAAVRAARRRGDPRALPDLQLRQLLRHERVAHEGEEPRPRVRGHLSRRRRGPAPARPRRPGQDASGLRDPLGARREEGRRRALRGLLRPPDEDPDELPPRRRSLQGIHPPAVRGGGGPRLGRARRVEAAPLGAGRPLQPPEHPLQPQEDHDRHVELRGRAGPGFGERDRLEDRVGSRIRSRLFEMCLMVTMRGDDFRRTVVQGQIRSRF